MTDREAMPKNEALHDLSLRVKKLLALTIHIGGTGGGRTERIQPGQPYVLLLDVMQIVQDYVY